ncbi:MAG: hypothetical protein PVF96_08450, partial [Candidatus Bathyarchaeota archaeon]
MNKHTFILIIILICIFCISNLRSQPKSSGIITNLDDQHNLRILRHKISSSELVKLKRSIGVSHEDGCSTQQLNGYGTGLRIPTLKEWERISKQAYVLDGFSSISKIGQLPLSTDYTTSTWFPPIGNQDGEGSCTAWAVGYYVKTFQEAKEHNWSLSNAVWEGGYKGHPTAEYQNKIFSPDFIYHQINDGVDEGSSFYDAIRLVSSIGACSWKNMPYNPDDHISWPSEDAWKEAAGFRGNDTGMIYIWTNTDQ